MSIKRAFVLVAVLAAAQSAGAAGPKKPRDLYLDYQGGSQQPGSGSMVPTSSSGMPGSKISIELNRGGQMMMVPPTTAFRTGDRIRLHFAINFPGYVAVVNKGSTGRMSLLFPYQGVSNHVQPTSDYAIPRDGWIRFDENPGQEELTFVMATRQIPELQSMLGGGMAPPPPGASQGGLASPTEEQEILAQLNGRALRRPKSGRDLQLEVDQSDAYFLASQQDVDSVVAVTLRLVHR